MKFDMTLARLKNEAFFIEPNFAEAALAEVRAFQQGEPTEGAHTELADNSVTYQRVQNVAVIAVDGPLYKKGMSGMCFSIASYEQLIKAHAQAEADEEVEKILYRVETPGGSVAGLEEFRQTIVDSTKPVYTYAENLMASAGMYAFTAAEAVYANEATILGSIGTIILYQEPKEKTLAIVSSNAPNKYCDISDEKCKSKMQARLDGYEDIFLNRMEMSYPEKDRKQIIEDFDRGGTIFATQAHKLGYVKDVLPFQALLESLVGDEMLSSEKTANSNDKGIVMTMEELQAQLDAANATIKANETEIGQLTARVTQLENQQTVALHAVKVGMEHGASRDTIVAAMELGTNAEAELAIYKADESGTSAVTTGETVGDNMKALEDEEKADAALLAFAKDNRV